MIPTCLIIASSKSDALRMGATGLTEQLREAFNADCVRCCSSLKKLHQLYQDCSKIEAVLYLNSFPESYKRVLYSGRKGPGFANVYKAEYEDDRIWLYNGPIVSDCVTEKDLPSAIKTSRRVKAYLDVYAPKAALIALAIMVACTILFSTTKSITAEYKTRNISTQEYTAPIK